MEDSRRILCGFCSPGSLKGPTISGTKVRLRERPAGYFMLRCDSQDLTLQAILSNGVATVRRTLLRTVDQHPPATDAFTPRSGYGWSRAKHENQAG